MVFFSQLRIYLNISAVDARPVLYNKNPTIQKKIGSKKLYQNAFCQLKTTKIEATNF